MFFDTLNISKGGENSSSSKAAPSVKPKGKSSKVVAGADVNEWGSVAQKAVGKIGTVVST